MSSISNTRGNAVPSSVRRVHAIDELIERATSASRTAKLVRSMALGASILFVAALVAILCDAALDLSGPLRVAIDLAILLFVVVGLVMTALRVRRTTVDPRHLARRLEEQGGIANNQLLNALEFERDVHFDPAAGAVSRELVGQTIEAGERIAPSLAPGSVVDRRSVRRALLWLPAVPALALVLHVAIPNLFAMTVLRFVDPLGHHPAFTPLLFDLSVSPDQVKHGRAAMISVDITGPMRAGAADVVFVDPSSPARELDAVAMVAEPDDEGGAERYALRVDRATESRLFIVRTPRGESAMHRLDVLPVPGFERASLTIRAPEYTKWPPQDLTFGGGGDIAALRDSTLVVRATSTLPLGKGRLVLTSPEGVATPLVLMPVEGDPKSVEGALPAGQSGTLELTLIGVDGTESDEKRSANLLVHADEAPSIRIIEPDEHCYVVEGWSLDVLFEAEDDVGIDRVEFVRGANGFPPTTVTLESAGGDATRMLARAHFDTKALGASAGDIIRCFGVAWDGHPETPHSARSNVVTIEVLSQKDYEELTRSDERFEDLTAEAQKFDEELRALAEERERLLAELAKVEAAEKAAEGGSEATESARQELAKKLDAFGEKAGELAKSMERRAEQPSLYDAEKPWQEALKQQAQGLRAQEQNADKLAGSCNSPAASAAGERRQERQQAGEKFKQESDPFGGEAMAESEAMQQDMEKLAAAERLLDKTEAVRQAILDQRAIADQMAQFRQRETLTPQEALQLQDLADEQEALGERLEQARTSLDEMASETAEKLPKMSAQAKEISKRIEESNAKRDQQSACESGRKPDGRGAHAAAESAAKKLESLLSECSSESQQSPMEQDLDGCLKMPKPGLKQALRQMGNARLGPMSSMASRGKRGGGSGFSGMQANASIVGPHRPNGKPNRESKKVGGHAETKTAADGDLAAYRSGEAESIDAGTSKTSTGAGSLLGVPAAYRDDAAAYFRRIAEDAKVRRTKPADVGGTP